MACLNRVGVKAESAALTTQPPTQPDCRALGRSSIPSTSGLLEEPRRGAIRAARRNGPGSWDDSEDEGVFEAQIAEIEGNAASMRTMAEAGFKTLNTPCDCPCCEVTLADVGAVLEHFRTEEHAKKMQSNLDELGEQIPEEMRAELRATIMFVKPSAPVRPVDAFACLQRAKASIARSSENLSPHVSAGQRTPHETAPPGQTPPAPGTQSQPPANSTAGSNNTYYSCGRRNSGMASRAGMTVK